MNRLLLTAILAALLWCGVELHHMDRRRHRPALPTSGPWPTTIHYYVPDGTCIHVATQTSLDHANPQDR